MNYNKIIRSAFYLLFLLGSISCSGLHKNKPHPVEIYGDSAEIWYDQVEEWYLELGKITADLTKGKNFAALRQPSNDPVWLIKRAAEVDESYYKEVAEACGAMLECATKFPPSGGKSLSRLKEKVKDQAFDLVFDYSRSTMIIPYDQTIKALQLIVKHWGANNVFLFKNRILQPAPGGYRDIRILIRHPKTNFISELLLLSQPMNEAKKGGGHKLYVLARAITNKAEKENRPLTSEEAKRVNYYMEKMQLMYNSAHNEALMSIKNSARPVWY